MRPIEDLQAAVARQRHRERILVGGSDHDYFRLRLELFSRPYIEAELVDRRRRQTRTGGQKRVPRRAVARVLNADGVAFIYEELGGVIHSLLRTSDDYYLLGSALYTTRYH